MNDLHNFYADNIDQITRSNGSKNCLNCGAPIESEQCPYCGSIFVDFACLDADKPFYMKIKHKGQIITLKVRLNNISMHTDYIDCYANNIPIITMEQTKELDMNFTII